MNLIALKFIKIVCRLINSKFKKNFKFNYTTNVMRMDIRAVVSAVVLLRTHGTLNVLINVRSVGTAKVNLNFILNLS